MVPKLVLDCQVRITQGAYSNYIFVGHEPEIPDFLAVRPVLKNRSGISSAHEHLRTTDFRHQPFLVGSKKNPNKISNFVTKKFFVLLSSDS